MRSLLLVISCCILTIVLDAQQNRWLWSSVKCQLNSREDSAFLMTAERKMWRESLSKNSFRVYTGFTGGLGYRVFVTLDEARWRFNDTTTAKLRFSNDAELVSLWNIAADTCMIVSYQPMLAHSVPESGMACWAHVPMTAYRNFLEKWETQKLHDMMMHSFARSLNATLSGDTLYRTVYFSNDSNNYLPQASWTHLAFLMKSGMMAGQLKAYSTHALSKPMSKGAIENILVQWDTLNHVEDPNNPGTYILAPIKHEEFETGIVVYERWVPDSVIPLGKPVFIWFPKQYMNFHREILAYGVRYSSGLVIWHSPAEVNALFMPPAFNWFSYEESFRAERFERMRITFD